MKINEAEYVRTPHKVDTFYSVRTQTLSSPNDLPGLGISIASTLLTNLTCWAWDATHFIVNLAFFLK